MTARQSNRLLSNSTESMISLPDSGQKARRVAWDAWSGCWPEMSRKQLQCRQSCRAGSNCNPPPLCVDLNKQLEPCCCLCRIRPLIALLFPVPCTLECLARIPARNAKHISLQYQCLCHAASNGGCPPLYVDMRSQHILPFSSTGPGLPVLLPHHLERWSCRGATQISQA